MRGHSLRRLALAAVAAVVIVVAPAPAVNAAPLADPAVATLSASPNTDLADRQGITVTAAGFPANHTLDLVQCAQDLGCDFSNLRVLPSDDTGGYTTVFFVHRVLHLGDLEVDCALEQNCILVSLDITDLSTGAQTSITFDPDAPPPPPLKFRVEVNPTGHVRVDKGVARITGTVHCNQPVFVDAFLELTQVWNLHIFRSEGFFGVACTGHTRFAVVFRPTNGLFGEGPATVKIDAFTFGPEFLERHKKVTVTLVPSGT